MIKISVIGMDIAKRVIQLHTVCPETGEIGRFKLQRLSLTGTIEPPKIGI